MGKLETALVTGASSGMGVAFAEQLAARGMNLVLTARRVERLEELATRLRDKHEVEVTVLPCDLGTPESCQKLYAEVTSRGLAIDVLINNAGGGVHQDYVGAGWEAARSQVQLNVLSLMELTHRFAEDMAARGRGYVLNVASIGAYMPVPYMSVYAASKAFVRNFSEGLSYELGPKGVNVCCLAPGGIDTEFFEASGQKPSKLIKLGMMSANRCASIGLRAMFGGRRLIVPGYSNAIGMVLVRLVPRRLITWIAAITLGMPKLPAPVATGTGKMAATRKTATT